MYQLLLQLVPRTGLFSVSITIIRAAIIDLCAERRGRGASSQMRRTAHYTNINHHQIAPVQGARWGGEGVLAALANKHSHPLGYASHTRTHTRCLSAKGIHRVAMGVVVPCQQ